MPKIAYNEKGFKQDSLDLIDEINEIVDDFTNQGYTLTLRQVYYQLVSRDFIRNNEKSYNRIKYLVNDGRLAGLIDWEAIVDRTRTLRKFPSWDTPEDLLRAAANQYKVDMWENQPAHVEVWVEKDALIDIVANACEVYDVPHFSCRGYTSQSEMWQAAQRFRSAEEQGRGIVVIHLGDHDPSGIDMSRDIEDRLNMFGADVVFKRIALNWDQILEYTPPPNPTKLTDSRSSDYVRKFGHECWELDALSPNVIAGLITDEIEEYIDWPQWKDQKAREDYEKKALSQIVYEYSIKSTGGGERRTCRCYQCEREFQYTDSDILFFEKYELNCLVCPECKELTEVIDADVARKELENEYGVDF
ncbi:hypothetical protein [Methanolapillus millepedarum]|uniref:Uncharacterized protein n=1 Tax=Methanolapillus millepedarum TaxID=3028296 RepID=A0AA96ZWM9_9EURY|nr:hypothetical protein MsAc7_17400 [Methanosarcinaceae archaeon Ac7]